MVYLKSPSTMSMDIQEDEIRLLEVKRSRHHFLIVNFQIKQLNSGTLVDGQIKNKAKLRDALLRIFQLQKQKHPKIVLALPYRTVISTRIQLPCDLNRKELTAEIANDLPHFFPGISSELYFDYVIVKKDQEHYDILLFATKAYLLNEYVELVREVGFVVKAVDSNILAASRVMQAVYSEQECISLLEVNVLGAQFCVIRGIDILIQQYFVFENLEDLAQQFIRFFNAIRSGHSGMTFQFLYLLGNIELKNHLIQLLEELSLTIIHPRECFPLSNKSKFHEKFIEYSPRLLVCYGLTLWK